MIDPRKQAALDKQAAKEASHRAKIAGIEFTPWPKIARLNREIVITEKIDGTNAAIGVIPEGHDDMGNFTPRRVYAQSRNNIITSEKDNVGFAAWVERNATILGDTLGPGLHFGEWWGVGIQRGYGLSSRHFSLFNTARWASGEGALALSNARLNGLAIDCVPVLYEGPWTECIIEYFINGERKTIASVDWAPTTVINVLKFAGSRAAPGFMQPEGIVIFHKASGSMFKVTCEDDAQPKGIKNA